MHRLANLPLLSRHRPRMVGPGACEASTCGGSVSPANQGQFTWKTVEYGSGELSPESDIRCLTEFDAQPSRRRPAELR